MEKKSKNAKTVEIKDSEKLTYEQLEQVAKNLNVQCKQLYQELVETKKLLANINDIEMLLSIIGKSEYFDLSFIDRCSKKVEEVVTTMLNASDEAIKEGQKELDKETEE